jgi:hypothetical protein
LQDPTLIAEVMGDIWHLARVDKISLKDAARRLAEQHGAKWVEIKALYENADFYNAYVKTGVGFFDEGAANSKMELGTKKFTHGGMTHLIQDLVITKAFDRAGVNITAFKFRSLLDKVQGKVKLRDGKMIDLGDFLWQQLYDLINLPELPINQPEVLFTFLKDILADLE